MRKHFYSMRNPSNIYLHEKDGLQLDFVFEFKRLTNGIPQTSDCIILRHAETVATSTRPVRHVNREGEPSLEMVIIRSSWKAGPNPDLPTDLYVVLSTEDLAGWLYMDSGISGG